MPFRKNYSLGHLTWVCTEYHAVNLFHKVVLKSIIAFNVIHHPI